MKIGLLQSLKRYHDIHVIMSFSNVLLMCIQPRKQALFSSFSLLLSISVSSFAVTLLPLAWSLPDQLRPELWIIFLTDTDLLESHSSPVYNLLLTFTWLPRLSTALFYIICISPSERFLVLPEITSFCLFVASYSLLIVTTNHWKHGSRLLSCELCGKKIS